MRERDITMTVDDKERKGYHHAITQSMITIPMDDEPTGSNNGIIASCTPATYN